MRFDFDGEEFPGAFVEYTDAWSMGERRRFVAAAIETDDALFAVIRPKITGIDLPALEGDAITKADQVTAEGLDRLDARLWQWFVGTFTAQFRHCGHLGEAMRRQPLSIFDTKPES